MARPAKLDKPVEKAISLPQSLIARTDLELFSELEGRVPHGKWSELISNLLRQHWEKVDRLRGEDRAAPFTTT